MVLLSAQRMDVAQIAKVAFISEDRVRAVLHDFNDDAFESLYPKSTRPYGVRHLLAAYDLGRDRLYGHVKVRKGRTEFLAFCRYLRSLYPPDVRIAIVLDNFSPHLSTRKDQRVSESAEPNNVEFAYVPFYASWLNRIDAQFTALRYFALDGTDHPSHLEQARMIRR
jgi:hypothetical protein